jgi:hypothetical protein
MDAGHVSVLGGKYKWVEILVWPQNNGENEL